MNDNKSKEELENLYKELDFGCDYTDNIPAILKKLNVSLAFTSYQAGRLMIVRSDGENLDVNFKSFERPMGLAATENGITLGIFTQVVNFEREDRLVPMIKKPLQKIEDDVTAPRITPKEQQGKGDTSFEAKSEDEREEQAIQNALTPEQREKRTAAREKMQVYQESLFAPVDERVDACFIGRSSHYSGMINIHDIDWGDEGLWVVNSSFSLSLIHI